jgi:GNAT superfamily N-acetyltransferase
MKGKACAIGGELVVTKLAGRMEDILQAFAVRAACFIGELDLSFSEEFDGQDFAASHLLAYLGDEPIGTVRVRWFQSFAMPDRLAVMQRFRGHRVGALLLERARALAESRGSSMLYTRTQPEHAAYFERQGWRRLDQTVGSDVVALVCPIDPGGHRADLETADAIALSAHYGDPPAPSPLPLPA